MNLYKISSFQFCETSSPKLTVWSLVMLLTMEDSRSRLEDADDSLLPGSKKKNGGKKVGVIDSSSPWRQASSGAFPQCTFSLVHHGRGGMLRPRLRGFFPVAVHCGPLHTHTQTHESQRIRNMFYWACPAKDPFGKAAAHKNKTKGDIIRGAQVYPNGEHFSEA